MTMPGINELLVPVIVKTDLKSFWMLSGLKAGRYMILPKYARPRNRNMKADYFIVIDDRGKAILCNDFLREVDTSRRFDAERFIIKLTKKELSDIFNKYQDPLRTIKFG